jgi:predicted ATPase
MFSLNIKNYRSFKDQNFDFSKINILIGENSSGKSSLIKFFLALKQSFQSPNNKEINFTLTGEYSDLGNYKETIYYHNEELPLEFEFEFKDYDKFFFVYFFGLFDIKTEKNKQIRIFKKLINYESDSLTKVSFSLSKELDNHTNIKTKISNSSIGNLEINFSEKAKNPKMTALFGDSCGIKYYDKKTDQVFVFDNLNYEKDGFLTLITGSSLQSSIMKYYGISEESFTTDQVAKDKVNAIFYAVAYLLIIQNYLKFHIDKIEYINPIKTYPSRIYLVKDDKQNVNINDIEDFVNFFSRNTKLAKDLLPDFIEVLNDFGILTDIDIIKDDRLPVRELRVKINNLFSNISDVGYGVSLQLPIILKCFLAEVIPERQGSIIFIEQPEVHLHPKLHAKLIETIFKLSKHTTYFIETHSEHIIRKLQVLVKEKKDKIEGKDITIHYLIRDENISSVTCHKIESNGKLSPTFASGFFDNSYLLSKALLD